MRGGKLEQDVFAETRFVVLCSSSDLSSAVAGW